MISMDKKYRTRGGRDVRLLCVDGPNTQLPIVGYIEQATAPMHWDASGKAHHGLIMSDLIEYHEPDIRTIWVNVYDGFENYYASERSAKASASVTAISIAQPVTFEVKRNG